MTLRLDYVTIFPDYFDPLSLSLLGKAAAAGLVETHVHDLRRWTHDRHRTVDDSPFGGGAGMVMRPEPFGEALDELGLGDGPGSGATVVVPTPAGRPLTQALVRELATRDRLVFLCGRYEGIDQRVLDHAAGRAELLEVSLGDYVLNGGEVAALAVTEAVVRLLPGVVGNAESLLEESHEDGLLEHPSYTRPPSWHGLDVPPVLLSGDHAAIAAWRHDQSVRRTAARRPDLLPPSAVAGEWVVVPAVAADARELLVLQLACWVTEAIANDTLAIPALHEGLDDVVAALADSTVWVVRHGGRLVGSARAHATDDGAWYIGRLMVAPDQRGRGLGRLLLEHALAAAPAATTTCRLITGAGSAGNQRMYRKAGFALVGPLPGDPVAVVMERRLRRANDSR